MNNQSIKETSARFFNRELSWIEFNARILDLAKREALPLMERLNFLGITAANFNEFFMVRVAGLKRMARNSPELRDASGLTPAEQLTRIAERARALNGIHNTILNDEILPLLKERGFLYVKPCEFSPAQYDFAKSLFDNEIFPVLTPLRIDPFAFPRITNLTMHAAFLLKLIDGITPLALVDGQGELFAGELPLAAFVQIPATMPRVVFLPCQNASHWTLLDDIITRFGTRLFPGYSVEETLLFRLTRDADFAVDEEAGKDFINAMKEILVMRQTSFPVRLNCNDTSARLLELLKSVLSLSDEDVYVSRGIIDAAPLREIALNAKHSAPEALFYPKWERYAHPEFAEAETMWDAIKMRDILIHTPYQSYESVVSFVKNAALDDSVLSIKMTLYRTSGASPIIGALEKAALSGKQVTVFVELKARFDEKQNIAWAERLEKAGVVVVYGIVNLKVHAKALLVIRKEPSGIRRYAHLSTGNFNEETAKLYSDFSLFTANTEIANDVILFFNIISGYSALQTMKRLSMSPADLKDKIIAMIEREIACSTPENPGLIIAKMNSLTHEEIIAALYRAAKAGVRIKLNVRGICTLVPGAAVGAAGAAPAAGETAPPIEVISIIDRYLEHARVFYFWNGGAEELYLSSADWMPRNLERRVELMFPVLQKDNFERIKKILGMYFSDTHNAFRLNADGSWEPVTRAHESSRAQETLHQLYKAQSRNGESPAAAFEVRRKG